MKSFIGYEHYALVNMHESIRENICSDVEDVWTVRSESSIYRNDSNKPLGKPEAPITD